METLNLEQLIQIEENEALGGIIDPLDLDPTPPDPDTADPPQDLEPDLQDPITKDPPAEEPPKLELDGMFNLFKEQGILKVPDDFAFDNTPEAFQKATETTLKALKEEAAESLKNAIPEEFRGILSYVLAGGRDLDAVVNAYSPISYDNADLDDEDTQREIIHDYYKSTTSMSDEKISSMVNNLAKIGNLKEEAVDAIDYLKEFREEQKKGLLAKQQEQEAEAARRNQEFISKIDDALVSSDFIASERKNKVKNFMFSQVTRSDNVPESDFNRAIRGVMSNPEHYVQLADILMDYDPTRGFTFDRFISKGKSAANTELRQKLDEALNPKNKLNKSNPAKSDVAQIDWTKLLKQID